MDRGRGRGGGVMLHGILFSIYFGDFPATEISFDHSVFSVSVGLHYLCNIIHLPDYNFLKDLCKNTFVELEYFTRTKF